jgi:hypothetical protein
MAKSYEDRFNSMFKAGARAADVRALIAETEGLLSASQDAQANAAATTRDPEISDDAARAARDEATGQSFAVERLTAKLDKLQSKLERLTETDQARAREAEYIAAAEENAALADELQHRWPALIGELTGILDRIEANDTRIEAANKIRPSGRPHLSSAEFVARKTGGGHCWPPGNVVPVDRLTKMKIPRFGSWGNCWPVDRNAAQRAAIQDEERRQILAYERSKTPEAKAAVKAHQEAMWDRYRLYHALGYGIQGIAHRGGVVMLDSAAECFLEMNSVQVDRARSKGIEVELSPQTKNFLQ